MEITYDMIEPLIARAEADGSKMLCEFYLPESDETIESVGRIRRINSIQSSASRVIKRQVTNQLRRSASRALRSALGGGFMGRMGTSVFNQASREQVREMSSGYSREEKNAGVLDAFSKVSEFFHLDETTNSWVKPVVARAEPPKNRPDLMTEFEKQLQKHPVTDHFEREVLARLLVEVANADGSISEEEQDYLAQYISEDLGTLDDFLIMDPLSEVECEELSANVRETVYMIAWFISLIDLDLENRERDILMEYGDMFGFKPEDKARLIMAAKHHVLENVIHPGINRDELFEYARKIQLSQREAEKCLINMKRRQ